MTTCHGCGRDLAGATAWARDVKVIEPGGVRAYVRYTCDDCETKRTATVQDRWDPCPIHASQNQPCRECALTTTQESL